MPNTSDQAKWLAASPTLVVAIIVAGLFAGYVLLVRNAGGAPHGESGFQERAEAVGISFQMNFLPKEQGERFRINLYDHGSGLAVGDYDNDGHEDIYFLNQHGTNALYRNTGDGSFADGTRRRASPSATGSPSAPRSPITTTTVGPTCS